MRSFLDCLQHRSLHRRLIAILLVLVLGFLLGVAGYILWIFERDGLGSFHRGGMMSARALFAVADGEANPAMVARRVAGIQRLAEDINTEIGLKGEAARVAYQVFRQDQGLVYRTAKAPEVPLADPWTGISDRQIAGKHWRVYTVRGEDGGTWVHCGVLEEDLKATRRQTLRAYLLILMVLMGILVLLFTVAARQGLSPLRALADRVRQRPPGDLAPLQAGRTYRETEPLVEALNELLAGTRALLEVQRRFIADAAHELRTPMAVMGTQAHVLAHSGNEASRGQALGALQEGLARGSHLIRQLLHVARLDAAPREQREEVFDLAALMQEGAAGLAPRMMAAGQELAYLGPDTCLFQGDPEAFASAVENLLENALKYAGSGARVELTLSSEAGALVLGVADDGPGVPLKHLNRLSERFFRVPGSRAQGSGLGLAIVRKVAEDHGGCLTLGTGLEGRGLGVHMTLPSAGGKAAGKG